MSRRLETARHLIVDQVGRGFVKRKRLTGPSGVMSSSGDETSDFPDPLLIDHDPEEG